MEADLGMKGKEREKKDGGISVMNDDGLYDPLDTMRAN